MTTRVAALDRSAAIYRAVWSELECTRADNVRARTVGNDFGNMGVVVELPH